MTDFEPGKTPSERAKPNRERLGGGGPLAILILLGTVIGGAFHQASIGFLVGLALGVLVAILIWRKGPR